MIGTEERLDRDRSAVILAGGRSRRFGDGDKALADLAGRPFFVRVVEAARTVADEVIVSCRRDQVDRFEDRLGSTSVDAFVEDRFDDAGPLAGIQTGFDAASGPYTALIACDMPLVDPGVLESLFRQADGTDGAVPRHPDGRLEPVQAVYHTRRMHQEVSRMLPTGGSVCEALDRLRVATAPTEAFPARSFHDVNTARDLAAAERLVELGKPHGTA